MTIDMQALIEKRPHLKEPLELYAKWQRFCQEISELLPKTKSTASPEESKAYPRENAGAIFKVFFTIFNLPGEEFTPLRTALENGELDFLQFPQDEYPVMPSLSVSDEELSGILFLFSKPYFQALREIFPLDGAQWEGGRCPLCSALPALSSIVEGPKRNLHCSYCGTVGSYRFIGCPNCGSEDTEKLNTIVSDDEPGFRVVTCDECQTYVKVMDHSILQNMTVDLADMVSLPLDIVAQEKGYARSVPNPISLKRIA
jgi:FdhE protein